eukprot:4888564-Amphidinium_carterae.3
MIGWTLHARATKHLCGTLEKSDWMDCLTPWYLRSTLRHPSPTAIQLLYGTTLPARPDGMTQNSADVNSCALCVKVFGHES